MKGPDVWTGPLWLWTRSSHNGLQEWPPSSAVSLFTDKLDCTRFEFRVSDPLIYRTCDPTFLENSRQGFDTLPPVWWRWLLARTLDGGNTFVVAIEANLKIGRHVIYTGVLHGWTVDKCRINLNSPRIATCISHILFFLAYFPSPVHYTKGGLLGDYGATNEPKWLVFHHTNGRACDGYHDYASTLVSLRHTVCGLFSILQAYQGGFRSIHNYLR